MSGRQGQAVTSWLMMIPLLVVPVVAIFGVPKLDLLNVPNAEGEEPELDLVLGEESTMADNLPPVPTDGLKSAPAFGGTVSKPSFGQASNQSWSDPFENPQGFVETAEHTTSSHTPSTSESFVDPFNQTTAAPVEASPTDPFSGRQNSTEQEVAYTRPPSSQPDFQNSSETVTPSSNESIVKWRQAVSRLNELGVQKFQLSQTEEPFVFQFECDLTHPDNPRITHRFHAEAGEPLHAVAKVIQQVETWSAQLNIR